MAEPHDIQLYGFRGSNSVCTAELILAHAEVPYEFVTMRPGLHAFTLKARRFPAITVPAMIIDGRKLNGSRTIAQLVADELAPTTDLLPQEPGLRQRVLDAERDGERLQNAVRKVFYSSASENRNGVRGLVDVNFAGLPSFARRGVVSVLIPAARMGHRVRVTQGPKYVARVAELLAVADAYVEEGIIGTDTPNIADFQFAPNVVALGELLGPMGEFVRNHRVWEPMVKLLPKYPVTFGISPPTAWVEGVINA